MNGLCGKELHEFGCWGRNRYLRGAGVPNLVFGACSSSESGFAYDLIWLFGSKLDQENLEFFLDILDIFWAKMDSGYI